jgi:hypothetical protein
MAAGPIRGKLHLVDAGHLQYHIHDALAVGHLVLPIVGTYIFTHNVRPRFAEWL